MAINVSLLLGCLKAPLLNSSMPFECEAKLII